MIEGLRRTAEFGMRLLFADMPALLSAAAALLPLRLSLYDERPRSARIALQDGGVRVGVNRLRFVDRQLPDGRRSAV